jgi:hypothetical protein
MIFILLVFMAIVSFITKQYFPGLSNLFATGMSIEVITSLIFLGIIAHFSLVLVCRLKDIIVYALIY